MQILADTNVPEEYVSALRGDGHEVVYSRDVPQLGPEATDDAITDYAETEDYAILSTDISDFREIRDHSSSRRPTRYVWWGRSRCSLTVGGTSV